MATREEILNKAFPKTVGGMIRPEEPIQTDWDFSTEFPQFLRNDLNLGDQENAFLRQLLSNDKITDEQIKDIKNQLANCDLRIVTEILKGLMSPDMLKKLNGIQEGALNNPHPATHPATMITQDAAHRFATDAEKTAWNGKANASHGNHVPATQTANNSIFLRNDNNWASITPGNIGAASIAHTHNYVGYNPTTLAPTTDWNTITTPGFYGIGQESPFSAAYNQPVGAYSYGVLVVFSAIGGASGGIAQTYYSHGGSQIWHRGGWDANGWRTWRCLFIDGKVAWSNITGKPTGKTAPTLTALINWDAMAAAAGVTVTQLKNIKNSQWGLPLMAEISVTVAAAPTDHSTKAISSSNNRYLTLMSCSYITQTIPDRPPSIL